MLKQLQNVVVTNADAPSDAHDLRRDFIMAPQIYWSSGLTGSFKLQACNDKLSWEDVPNSSISVAGSAGHQMWNIEKCGFEYARVYFTYSSGGGSYSTLFNSKGGG